MLEVAEGIHYIHAEGMVHGDFVHGVSTLILNVPNQFIPLLTRKISCLTLISTVKFLVSGQLDMPKPLSLEPRQHIMCASNVVSPIALPVGGMKVMTASS